MKWEVHENRDRVDLRKDTGHLRGPDTDETRKGSHNTNES